MCGSYPLRQPSINHTKGRYGSSLHSSIKCVVSHCKKKNMRWVDHWPYQFNICFFQMSSTVSKLRNYNKVFIYILKDDQKQSRLNASSQEFSHKVLTHTSNRLCDHFPWRLCIKHIQNKPTCPDPFSSSVSLHPCQGCVGFCTTACTPILQTTTTVGSGSHCQHTQEDQTGSHWTLAHPLRRTRCAWDCQFLGHL